MKKILEKIPVIFLLVLCIYVCIYSIGYIGDSDFLKKISLNAYVINIVGVLFLFFTINLIYLILKKYNIEENKKVPVIAYIIIIILQIIFVINLKSIPINDSGIIYDEALSMLDDNDLSSSIHWGYFTRYTANQFFAILLFFIFKISSVFRITNFIMVKNFVNILAIDLFLLFIYKILQKAKNRTTANKFIIFAVFNPLIYIMTPYMYTNTISLPFLAAIILIFLKLRQSDGNKKKILYSLLLGVVSSIAFSIRVTTFIALIAIFINLLLKANKINLKKTVLYFSIFICAFLTVYLLGNLIKNQYINFDDKDTRFPVFHWIMMGAQYPGTYKSKDVSYTRTFGNYEDRKKANVQLLKERIHENSIRGNIELIAKKIGIVWGEGSSKYKVLLDESQEYTTLYKYIIGSKGDFAAYYSQVYRILTFLLIILSIINYLRNNKNEIIFTCYLTLLGAIIFFIIWEANKTYGMSFMPILMILASDGIENISNFLQIKKPKKIYNTLMIISSIVCIIILIANFNKFTDKNNFKDITYSVNQTKTSTNGTIRIYGKKKLIQTFKTSKAFNNIDLKLTDPRNITGMKYKIKILDEENNLLRSKIVLSDNIKDSYYTNISFRTIRPSKEQEYKIIIYAISKSNYYNSINILSYRSDYYDKVKSGNLSLEGKIINGDMTFRVYNSKNEVYFSKKEYITLSIISILFLLFIILFYNITLREE